MNRQQNKWLAIVNPTSGNGKTEEKWPIYYNKIVRAGIDLDYVYTSFPGDGITLTRKALADGYSKIIAVGGDGTVNEVVNGLIAEDKPIESNIEFAIFGHGTGSDFVRTLKSENDIHAFILSLQNNKTRLIDIGKVGYQNRKGEKEARYFINASNLGIGAEVVHRVNQNKKALGSKLTYLTGTMATLFQYKNIQISMELDDHQTLEGPFCGLMICNGQYIGGGMHIAPVAEIDDGLFDVIVVKDITKRKLISKFPLIYSGKHINLPEIDLYHCRSISMTAPETAILETDGEILGFSPHEFHILPKCLRLKM